MRKAFQTLENRDIDKIEKDGPFKCSKGNAWLGDGYYFWDSFIEVAHWWGTDGAFYKTPGYVICQAFFEFNEEKCFNLVDNPEHLEMFNETKNVLRKEGLYEDNKTTVARIIEFLKRKNKSFNFEAIRAYGVNSIGKNSFYSNRTIFVYKNEKAGFQYLDSTPAIQICFFRKNSLGLNKYKIIYPPEYTDEYLV